MNRLHALAVLGGAAGLLAGCGGSGEPSNSDIEHGYANRGKLALEEMVRQYGSEKAAPPFPVAIAKFTYNVEKTACEKASTDTGWNCVYNLTAYNRLGQILPDQPVRNVQGRIYKVDTGWMVEEKPRP